MMEEHSYILRIQNILDEISKQNVRKMKLKKMLDECGKEFFELELQAREERARQQKLDEFIPCLKQEHSQKSRLNAEKKSEIMDLEFSISLIKSKLEEVSLEQQEQSKKSTVDQLDDKIQARILRAATNIHIYPPSKATSTLQGVVKKSTGELKVFNIKRTSGDKNVADDLWELAFLTNNYQTNNDALTSS